MMNDRQRFNRTSSAVNRALDARVVVALLFFAFVVGFVLGLPL